VIPRTPRIHAARADLTKNPPFPVVVHRLPDVSAPEEEGGSHMGRTIGAAVGAILFVLFAIYGITRTPNTPASRPIAAAARASR
jgi:hypothetical protein